MSLWECMILLAFWLGGLAAYLMGGMIWLGWIAEAFIWAVFVWAARRIYHEVRDEILEEIERSKAFGQWAKRQNRRME